MSNKLRSPELSALLAPVLKRYGVKSAALFGSAARQDAGPDSDVDLLVEYPEGMSALTAAGLKHELEDLLGRNVDLASVKYLKPGVRETAQAEQVRIY